MTKAVYSGDETPDRLTNFLTDDNVQSFLEREEIDPDDVEWFANTFIKNTWHAMYPEEAVGAVSLMYLTGMCKKTVFRGEKIYNIDGCARILGVLRYDDEEPEGWEELNERVRKRGPFTKAMQVNVDRIHSKMSGESYEDYDQRDVLAYAQIQYKSRRRDLTNKEKRRICEKFDTTFSAVNRLHEAFVEACEE